MRKHWKRTLSLLAVAAAVGLLSAALALGKKPPKPPPEPPPPPPLPSVRYRINFPTMPAGSDGQILYDMNELGMVVGWSYLVVEGHASAFVYDSVTDQTIDLNTVVTAGLPDGWRFNSAKSINNWMVVVGTIELTGSDPVQRRRVAMDLAMENPVIDVLPEMGEIPNYALKINDNGDIVGLYRNGGNKFFVFNPGLYGDPLLREDRDGTPLDMSDVIPEVLPITSLSTLQWEFHLNNPVGSRPAQITGTSADKVASRYVVFRYTLGDAVPELFPELDINSDVHGFNDEGTLCGRSLVPRYKKRRPYYAPYRYNPDWAEPLDQLPVNEGGSQSAYDINASGDLVFSGGTVYRDDWGGYVDINDILVGTDDDLLLWFSEGGAPFSYYMSDRVGPSDSGLIAGEINVSGAQLFFVLTPEPAPPDP